MPMVNNTTERKKERKNIEKLKISEGRGGGENG